jgi:hypothetical protein
MSRLLWSVACLAAAFVNPSMRSSACVAAGETGARPVARRNVHEAGVPNASAGRELRRAVKAALAQPLADGAEAERRQARELLALHGKITATASLTASERERLLIRLRGRLGRLAKSLARRLADERENEAKPAAQAEPPAAAPSAASSVSGTPSVSPATSDAVRDAAAAGAAGGGGQSDGQQLIDLIQATIAPQSWDVNGGRGTIVYWQLGHALVVRQTSEVHEQIGGVVGGLRK